ncbi:amidohydrolase [Oceanihabitans sp. 2_MG-2023]|uniref:amidohydrolase n=1 Tax=Oceanihabitans sp. 2_MG-2023 TaxID=3062661 RepID=UPI0026E1888E|nr:amidohydrolase [Oceanihabitans sp. 2_MG-2023]MDO6595578.1 amidohydrolase [Oceanihabitans sp. 2_MG-2023]
MQEKLKIALVQSDLIWENPKENRLHFTNKIKALETQVDLIILPEMFTTGFTMHASTYAETMQGESVSWMLEMAKTNNTAIVGSLIIAEENKYYNRLLFVQPDAKVIIYDKRHTFTLAGEDKVYQAGNIKVIVDYKGWKICPLICYDLRFPVWARNTENYDLLLYVANWPKPRITAWDALLKARAIENMTYCVGVNRVGFDINRYEYSGSSAVYNVLGEKVSNIVLGMEQTEVVTLDKNHIKKHRDKLQFLGDKDHFNLKV